MRYSILLALLLGAAISSSAQVITAHTISTESLATVYAEPDEIYLQFSLQHRGETLAEVRQANEEQFAHVRNFLVTAGVSDEHIQTEYLRISPEYNRNWPRELQYYAAYQSITICLNDLDRYDRILDGLLALDISSVGNPSMRTVDYTMHRDKALQSALEACRQKATMMAATLGQSIGKATYIEEMKSQATVSAYANVQLTEVQAADNSSRSFAAGTLPISARVKVVFELLDEK